MKRMTGLAYQPLTLCIANLATWFPTHSGRHEPVLLPVSSLASSTPTLPSDSVSQLPTILQTVAYVVPECCRCASSGRVCPAHSTRYSPSLRRMVPLSASKRTSITSLSSSSITNVSCRAQNPQNHVRPSPTPAGN